LPHYYYYPCAHARSVTKDDKNAGNFANLVRAIKGSFNGTKLGVCVKDAASHPGVPQNLAAVWLNHASERGGLAAVEVGGGWSHVLAEKDAAEVGCVQKAAVMSNKVLKHGFVKEMESIFEEEGKQVCAHAPACQGGGGEWPSILAKWGHKDSGTSIIRSAAFPDTSVKGKPIRS